VPLSDKMRRYAILRRGAVAIFLCFAALRAIHAAAVPAARLSRRRGHFARLPSMVATCPTPRPRFAAGSAPGDRPHREQVHTLLMERADISIA